MKFRAVANGNIVDDVPAGLVTAGIYVPVDDEGEPTPVLSRPAPTPAREVAEPLTTAVAPLTTDVVPQKPRKPRRK